MKPALLLVAVSLGCAGCSTSHPGAVAEADLPPGELAGLTAEEKRVVLEATNAEPLSCGVEPGTYANCRARNPAHPRAARGFDQAVELARLGRSSAEIREAIRRMPTAETAPIPKVRYRDGHPVEPEKIHVHPGDGNHGL